MFFTIGDGIFGRLSLWINYFYDTEMFDKVFLCKLNKDWDDDVFFI
jgi:hypothetical protein